LRKILLKDAAFFADRKRWRIEGRRRRDLQANEVNRKFSAARMALKTGDILKCLTQFKAALEGFETVHVLPAEKAVLEGAISALQTDLTSNEAFKKVFGPVTFADADVESTATFLGELIKVYEEQVVEGLEKNEAAPEPGTAAEKEPEGSDLDKEGEQTETNPEDPIETIIAHIKSEKADEAKALIGSDEDILSRVLNRLNSHGMSCRKAGRIDEAINTYESCLLVCDDDEGIFFNLARAYMDGGRTEQAFATINKALAINPDFREGQSLLQMISTSKAA
jgi:tetratricopeptide (TPR) repeat protein